MKRTVQLCKDCRHLGVMGKCNWLLGDPLVEAFVPADCERFLEYLVLTQTEEGNIERKKGSDATKP